MITRVHNRLNNACFNAGLGIVLIYVLILRVHISMPWGIIPGLQFQVYKRVQNQHSQG